MLRRAEHSDIAAQLRAAWLALDPPVDRVDELGQNVLDRIVKDLVIIAAGGAGDPAVGRQFRVVSHAASLAELDRLAEILGIFPALTAALAGLHKPAILALADEGILRQHLHRIAAASVAWAAAIERAKQRLPADDQKKPHEGAPRKVRAQLVAGLISSGYRELFGSEAPRAVGGDGVPALVRTIFQIMRIKADPKRATIAARKTLERAAEEERAGVAQSS